MHTLAARFRTLASKSTYTARLWRYLRRIYYHAHSLVVSDEYAVERMYQRRTGSILNLKDPKGFNEKLAWLKINNRHSLMTECTDKILVRDYVKSLGFGDLLNKLYGTYGDATDIDFSDVPSPVFLKTNHGSGTNMLWDATKPFDIDRFRTEFNDALKSNYYEESREWNYKDIRPRILAEEVIANADELVDYRLLCFDGKMRVVFVDIGTAASDGSHAKDARRNVYDRDFKLLNIKVERENYPPELVKQPQKWNQMIEIAESLSEPFVFCRVDLYNIDGEIRFGEITFYPGSGGQKIEPKHWDLEIGSWIDLQSSKIVKRDSV